MRALTPGERRERGTRLCARLAEDVASIVPAGIGAWDETWRIVDPADASFMEALVAWESDPSKEALDRVRSAYRGVLCAWRSASAAFERQRAER